MQSLKVILLIAAFLFAGAYVQAEQPLTQEGKKTVFQRVVTHPGATIYKDESASESARKPRTFTALYIYEKKGDMLRVGPSASRSEGWVKASEVTEWPQAITMLFTDQFGNREPVLFFRDHQALVDLCNSDGIGDTVKEYVSLFENPEAPKPADLPVIATEPLAREGQISQKNFYLLPVLAIDQQFKEGGAQLLEVASIDPGISGTGAQGAREDTGVVKGMKTGLAFVVDTTISMGPYIEQTKQAIRSIFEKLKNSPAKDNVEIAVVAFRSNPELRKATEYNTRQITDFVSVNDQAALEAALQGLEECAASTHAFDEDSMAGVKEAIDGLSWNRVDARAMLLVTDAGPLAADDPAGKTGMSPEAMADYLKTKKIYLTVAHVITPAGKKDKPYAEKSYKALSLLSNNRSSYVPIHAPDPKTGAAEFKKVADMLGNVYTKVSEQSMRQKAPEKPVEAPVAASAEELARQTAEAIGYAMRLQFAGDRNKTRAPQVVKAWIADADLASLEANPSDAPVPVVTPAVLLTKSQLSRLREQVRNIVATAEEAFLQDSANFNFYEQLISAAAQMSRDPASFSDAPDANLAQKGVLLEVLDGLPYKSQVVRMKQEDWTNMSTGSQQEFIRRLKGLLKLYEEYDRDNEKWESFGADDPNEWVYRVPLTALP